MGPELAAGAWDMPMCSRCPRTKRLQHSPGIRMGVGETCCVRITRLQRRCWARGAIQDFGKLIGYSNRWQTKFPWDIHFAQQTSVLISEKRVSRYRIPTSAAKVRLGRAAITVAGAWWDVVTTPR